MAEEMTTRISDMK